jgi:hypothetical protein
MDSSQVESMQKFLCVAHCEGMVNENHTSLGFESGRVSNKGIWQ